MCTHARVHVRQVKTDTQAPFRRKIFPSCSQMSRDTEGERCEHCERRWPTEESSQVPIRTDGRTGKPPFFPERCTDEICDGGRGRIIIGKRIAQSGFCIVLIWHQRKYRMTASAGFARFVLICICPENNHQARKYTSKSILPHVLILISNNNNYS